MLIIIKMYGTDAYKILGIGMANIPDENEILNLKELNPIGELIKNNGSNIGTTALDSEDTSNLMNWFNNYKIIYSYPESEHKLSKKWQGLFKEINVSKGKSDIMGLVEIAIGRLLQNKFDNQGHNVRVRKTTNFDDITSGIDYIIEFFDKKGDIVKVIGMDFTVSERGADSLSKNFKKSAFPEDYKKFYEKKHKRKLHTVSRVVFTLSKDLAYSFTNNFFIEVLEKGNLLDNEEIDKNLSFALQDLNKKSTSRNTEFVISDLRERTNSSIDRLLHKK